MKEPSTNMKENTFEKVRDYYGRVLQRTSDLKTSACCVADRLPTGITKIMEKIDPEILDRFYGCGVIAPAVLEGKKILDLGCGTGRDVFVLSKLVGPQGSVVGIDMTEAQLKIGKRHTESYAKAIGHKSSNITLCQGYIEDLESVGIKSESIDLVVSNCVINLSPAKERVFSEIFRVLRPGGELHFSDVFCDRRLPAECAEDPILLGECLGGAMYFEDFRRLIAKIGCGDIRVLSRAPIVITNSDVASRIGNAAFSSLTIRAFKINLEDRCEDYGQIAEYLGTIPDSEHAYRLDDNHLFEAHRQVSVCRNTAAILTETRLSPHFRVSGGATRHFGLFACNSENQLVVSQNDAPCC
jgi:SAM-dependent methyltransferase